MVDELSEVELPKLRIVIDDGWWHKKNAINILKDAIIQKDNWALIQSKMKELYDQNDFDGPDTKNKYVQLNYSFEREVVNLGDIMMDIDQDPEDFEKFIRCLDEKSQNKWFRHVHKTEFLKLSEELIEKAEEDGVFKE